MKSTALCFACIWSFLLFSTAPLPAAETKTVFTTESMKYESGTGSERCRDKCSRKSGPDVKSLLSRGWTIVSSSPKEVVAEDHWYVPCSNCKPHGCICIGTEYVLRRDVPEPAAEAAGNPAGVAREEDRTGPRHSMNGTPANRIELLERENDQLKRENAILKQENAELRSQMKSQQK